MRMPLFSPVVSGLLLCTQTHGVCFRMSFCLAGTARLQPRSRSFVPSIFFHHSPHASTLSPLYDQNNKSLHYHNNSAYRIASIDGAVNTRTAASIEVQAYPTIKLIQQGMVWTFRDTQNMTTSNILQFASEHWKEYAWFNKLPTTWSVWFKLQLDLFNTICGMLAALEATMGALSTSESVTNLLSYTVLVGSVIGVGVLLPFGIVYMA